MLTSASKLDKVSFILDCIIVTLYSLAAILGYISGADIGGAIRNTVLAVLWAVILGLHIATMKRKATHLDIVSSKEE